MTHSDRCLEAREAERSERAAFLERFPRACVSCNATGLVSWNEPREFWGAACSETLSEDCQNCLGGGNCPRCGEELSEDQLELELEKIVCQSCGWSRKSAALPEVLSDFECGCFEAWLEERCALLGEVNTFQTL